jgi:hypothetical protein
LYLQVKVTVIALQGKCLLLALPLLLYAQPKVFAIPHFHTLPRIAEVDALPQSTSHPMTWTDAHVKHLNVGWCLLELKFHSQDGDYYLSGRHLGNLAAK